METQGVRDEVLALKQFLQGMILTDLDERSELSLPESGKGVIRNDKLLELMGVAVSETSSSAGCSAYSLDDERPAAVAPLQILSPPLHEKQNSGHDFELNLEVIDRVDADEITDEDESVVLEGEEDQQEGYFSRGYVNKMSEALLWRSGTFEPDFQARMKQFLLKNQQKKERIRQSLKVADEPDIDPTPRINERSKSIPRNVSHLMAWNNEKENKLARLRDAETAKQEAVCVGKPSISKRSVSIFSKRRDDVAQCKVEDRLHLLGLIYQYQLEERKRAEERRESSGLQPCLAPHSANAQRWRRFSVHERLYQLSKRSQTAIEEYDRDIRQRNPAARRRGRSSNSRGLVGTAQRLHALDKKYKQKQQLLGDEQKQYFDNLRTAPKMSARSRKLAARRKKNPAPKSPVRCGCCGGKEDNEGKCGCTIEPRVNQKHAADIYERQLKWKNANEARHTKQKQLQDTLVMTECTFRNPFYQKAWNTLDNKSPDKEIKPTSGDFFERCMLWAEKRDQQVALEKKAFQERQLEECTFKPRVIARTPKYLARKSNRQDDTSFPQIELPRSIDFQDCSMAATPEHQDVTGQDELVTQLYSALDLQVLAGELSPEYNSIGSDDEGAHGFPKYTFTDLGEFAGR